MDETQRLVLEQVRKQIEVERAVRCAVCASEARGALNACGACGTIYHADCWRYNGGCAVYGCTAAPPPEEPIRIEVTAPPRRRWRTLAAAIGALACFALGLAIGEHEAAARAADDPIDDDLTRIVELQAMSDYILIPARDMDPALTGRAHVAADTESEMEGADSAELSAAAADAAEALDAMASDSRESNAPQARDAAMAETQDPSPAEARDPRE